MEELREASKGDHSKDAILPHSPNPLAKEGLRGLYPLSILRKMGLHPLDSDAPLRRALVSNPPCQEPPAPSWSSGWGPALSLCLGAVPWGQGLQKSPGRPKTDSESWLRQVRRGLGPGTGQLPRAGAGAPLQQTLKASGMENPEGRWGGKDGGHHSVPRSCGEGLQASDYPGPSSNTGPLRGQRLAPGGRGDFCSFCPTPRKVIPALLKLGAC